MATFSYIGQDRYKNIVHGEIEATSEGEAAGIVSGKGITLVKLDLVYRTSAGGKSKRLSGFTFGKFTLFDQITFVRHLGTILGAGTGIIAALELIARDSAKPIVKEIAYDIREHVAKGELFSQALFRWRDQFSPVFVSVVKAGESSGDLPTILVAYSKELRKDFSFQRKFKNAMVYPGILVGALAAMLILIFTVVIPKVEDLFTTTKAPIPWYTQIFFSLSNLWVQHQTASIVASLVVVFALIASFSSSRIRGKLRLLLWYVPYAKRVEQNLVLMRFCKTTAQLLDAGFTLETALQTTAEVVGPRYAPILRDLVANWLRRGIAFSEALGKYPREFPEILTGVIATSEDNGQIPLVLNQMAEFYEEEVMYELELTLTLIQPILLGVTGIIIGFLAASLFAPIYQLIGQLR